jgi:hypothetical protein
MKKQKRIEKKLTGYSLDIIAHRTYFTVPQVTDKD